jgi:2-polyprenyl-3-methyl-5-hydroxy-6-metoxy-1,4-benzoquinol methylase
VSSVRPIDEDKAGHKYWDRVWADEYLPEAINPRLSGVRNYYKRRVDELLRQVFSSTETKGKKLLEIGCAKSAWLPYFAKEFGFDVYGLDYSEVGCEQERRVLAEAGVQGEIIYSDFFTPPPDILGVFDVVYSAGVAEHFQDTAQCIAAFAAFLKPGGLLLTFIPNMTGANGLVQKVVNRQIYDIHVPLTADDLRDAHLRAGLKVVSCDYFLSTNFLVSNAGDSNSLKRLLLAGLGAVSGVTWALESYTMRLPATALFSPYVVCVARKSLTAADRDV